MRRIANFLVISADYQDVFDAETTVIDINSITMIFGNGKESHIDTPEIRVRINKPIDTVIVDFEKSLEEYEWL